jgi:hypothetical protein
LLHVPHLVDDQAIVLGQLFDLFAQPQITLGRQQILHQGAEIRLRKSKDKDARQ